MYRNINYNSLSNINFNILNNINNNNILNININNINKHIYKFDLKCKGVCWSQSMEIEANFIVNPEVDVNLFLPVLKNKYKYKYNYLKDHYKFIVYNRDQEEGFNYIINLMRLDDTVTPSNFEQYVKSRIKKRIENGFKEYERYLTEKGYVKYMLQQLASHQVLEETKISEIPCTCHNSLPEQKAAMMQILPVALNDEKCIIYNSCLRTLFAAFKRQLKATPRPENDVMDRFIKFSKKIY